MHNEQHPFAGKKMRIKAGVKHPHHPDFAGSIYHVEDWWDRLGLGSWMQCGSNTACLIYTRRLAINDLPMDNSVVYGKVGSFGHLLHVSELEELPEDNPDAG